MYLEQKFGEFRIGNRSVERDLNAIFFLGHGGRCAIIDRMFC
jgi:hypothetical protein